MPTSSCHLAKPPVPFEHIWEHTVGHRRPLIALRADWQTQLRRCRAKLGFLPQMLASALATVFRYRGNITLPRDCGLWASLIRKLVEHWLRRYGGDEVRRWCTFVIQGLRRTGFTGAWL